MEDPSSLIVERWRAEHALGAVEVVRAVFDEYGFTWDEQDYHADLYDVQGQYLDQGDEFFVAVIDGQVRGTCGLELFPTVAGEPGTLVDWDDMLRIAGADCSLERLYVHPEWRAQGLGFALAEAVVMEARSRGRSFMEIWSDKRFTAAHRLYERLGAETVGERICNDPDASPEWGLALRLMQAPR